MQNFKRNLDPRNSLGIGEIHRINEWINSLEDVNTRFIIMKENFLVRTYYQLNLSTTLYKHIKELPKNLEVFGYLDINGTSITRLPDNLRVHGDLYLGLSPIVSLPKGLWVKGSLDISGTLIKEIPDDISIGKNFIKNVGQM